MLTDVLKLGDKLNLKQVETSSNKEYSSKLIDLKKDDKLIITMPIVNEKIILLNSGAKYSITFYTGKGLFICLGVLKKRYKMNNIYVAEVKLVEKLKRVQRRQYFRVACLNPMKLYYTHEVIIESIMGKLRESNTAYGYTDMQLRIRAIERLLSSDRNEGTQFVKMKKAVITDISGGGLRFKTKEPIESEEVYLVFEIDDGKKIIHAFGKMIESILMEHPRNLYDNRLKFTEISSLDREEIVRYVLNKERILRQKEKEIK